MLETAKNTMKIPQIFTPERNLDKETYRLLEGKEKKSGVEEERGDFCQKNIEVSLDMYVAHVQVQQAASWLSQNRLHVESVENLIIHYEGHNDVHVKLTAPILRCVYEKKTNASNMSDVTRKEYKFARSKAEGKLIRLREHMRKRYGFDFHNLVSKVVFDEELSFELYKIFKDIPKGGYEVEFQENGCNRLRGAGFTRVDHIELYNFYNSHLVKYLPRGLERDLEKGFFSGLKKSLKNIFKKS